MRNLELGSLKFKITLESDLEKDIKYCEPVNFLTVLIKKSTALSKEIHVFFIKTKFIRK